MVINISLICYLTGAAVKDRTVIFGYLIAVFISKIVDDVKIFPTKEPLPCPLNYIIAAIPKVLKPNLFHLLKILFA